MNEVKKFIDTIKSFTENENILISKTPINNSLYRELLIGEYYIYVTKDCSYKNTYLIKQICEMFFKEYKRNIENEEQMMCFKGMVNEFLNTSKLYADEGYKEAKSFEFLNGEVNYSIIRDTDVIINKKIDKFTLETSVLKLKMQDEFTMLVKEGEVYGYKHHVYKAVLSSEKHIDEILKSALKVRLIFLNKLYENEAYFSKLKDINFALEQLVKERTEEIESKNRMLEEEKEKLRITNERLTYLNNKLSNLSKTDPLTKLSNRRDLRDKFRKVLKELHSKQVELSLIMCDIDYFKKINDTYGHDCGDKVLIRVAEVLKFNLRDSDIIARYGGEEFIIILPKSCAEDSMKAAEDMRKRIQEEVFDYNGIIFNVTMSFGIYNFKSDASYSNCIKKADEALYKAKKIGRNKVIAI